MARRASIRVRLTALYGLAFFLAGAAVVIASYLLVRTNLTDHLAPVKLEGPGPTLTVAPFPAPPAGFAEALIADRQAVRDATLRALLVPSVVALVVIGLLAVGIGWVTAGRALAPIHRITATARRVAGRHLHERIALAGPRDELRELADTFDAMLDRLDRAFDTERRFVADASHELRTPLAINRSLIEVAARRPGAPPAVRDLAAVLLGVNARHEQLVDGLLLLARSRHDTLDRHPLDLADVAADVVAVHPGPPEITLDAAPAPTVGDPVLLDRLVANLVENGVRHNLPAGGRVHVATGTDGDTAFVTVTNTGPTVPATAVDGLFAPFRRLPGRTAGGGAGLGLSIVASVAAAHGGTATAAARPTGGLTVNVRLPAGDPTAPRPA